MEGDEDEGLPRPAFEVALEGESFPGCGSNGLGFIAPNRLLQSPRTSILSRFEEGRMHKAQFTELLQQLSGSEVPAEEIERCADENGLISIDVVKRLFEGEEEENDNVGEVNEDDWPEDINTLLQVRSKSDESTVSSSPSPSKHAAKELPRPTPLRPANVLAQELRENEERIAELLKEREEAEKAIKKLRKELSQQKDKNQRDLDERDELEAEHKEELLRLETKLASLNKTCQEQKEKEKQLLVELAQSKEETRELNEQIKGSKKLKTENEMLLQTLEDVSTKLQEAQADRQHLSEENKKLQEENQHLDRELKRTQYQADQFQHHSQILRVDSLDSFTDGQSISEELVGLGSQEQLEAGEDGREDDMTGRVLVLSGDDVVPPLTTGGELEHLKRENEALREKLENLERQPAVVEISKAQLESERGSDSNEAQSDETERLINKYREEKDNLEAELKLARANAHTLREELTALQARYASLMDDVRDLQDAKSALETERQLLQKALDEGQGTVEALQQQLGEWQQRHGAAEAELLQQRSNSENAAQRRAEELKQHTDECKMLLEARSVLEAEARRLDEALTNSHEQHRIEVEQLKQQINELLAKLASAAQAHDVATLRQSAAEQLQARIDELKDELHRSELDRAVLARQLETDQAQRRAMEAQRQADAQVELEEQRQRDAARIQHLQQALADSEQKCIEQAEELARADAKQMELQNEYLRDRGEAERLREEVEQLRRQLKEATQRQQLQNRIHSDKEDSTALQEALVESERKREELANRMQLAASSSTPLVGSESTLHRRRPDPRPRGSAEYGGGHVIDQEEEEGEVERGSLVWQLKAQSLMGMCESLVVDLRRAEQRASQQLRQAFWCGLAFLLVVYTWFRLSLTEPGFRPS